VFDACAWACVAARPDRQIVPTASAVALESARKLPFLSILSPCYPRMIPPQN
jgi:hypothetical protein